LVKVALETVALGLANCGVSTIARPDTGASITAATSLHKRAGQPNLFIKIPGTKEGLQAIEESIFAGIQVNVTLLFSREQYLAAADGAYLRGVERRIDSGLDPNVGSVASLFIGRRDAVVIAKVPESPRSKLGMAIAGRTYKAYCELLASARWQRALPEDTLRAFPQPWPAR
jgi:transaldolase